MNRLKSLNGIPGLTVEGKGTIYISYQTECSLNFKFVWSDEHYIGYFMDEEGKASQAVISLWNPMDAIYFATAYSLLVELRAGRREH
ncbi:hypothetical protein ACFLX5_05295 [Chloroflexota bacterium]